jgi:hypothetical protein
MTSMRSRAPRKAVRICVRLATDDGWGDAEVRNVSSGGLMAVCPQPPSRGSYVELRRETYSIVGRVVWSSGTSFGIQARQEVSLPELIRPRSRNGSEDNERRAEPREPERLVVGRKTPHEIAEASARRARIFEFAILVATAVAFAFLLADQAAGTLIAPLSEVQNALGKRNGTGLGAASPGGQ